jgi:carboxymethylenebutenolidase
MIRVMIPTHLSRLANTGRQIELRVEDPVTLNAVLEALEAHYPMLRGTIRDHNTKQRRPFIRFFALGQDLSHEPPDAREATRRFAHHGYVALCPNLYFRAGHGTPEDVAAKVRGQGGIPDDQAVGDLAGALDYLRSLPNVSSKVGIFGTCSGGRHSYLAACRTRAFDAVVDCWGGGVVMGQEALTPNRPVAPIDYTADLNCPLLGLFGEEDSAPSPEQVALHEQELQRHGKTYEFHMYPGAGHGFFYYHRPNYRPQQAVDGWEKIFAFLKQHLST